MREVSVNISCPLVCLCWWFDHPEEIDHYYIALSSLKEVRQSLNTAVTVVTDIINASLVSVHTLDCVTEMEEMPREKPVSSLIWLGLAPQRMEPFCWLGESGKVSTVDNLKRRGILL